MRVPNTLVHFAAQLGREPRAAAPSIGAGSTWAADCPTPPWILRRAVVGLGLPTDTFDLRLYTMAQALLAGTLLLGAALASVTVAPRLVLAVLG